MKLLKGPPSAGSDASKTILLADDEALFLQSAADSMRGRFPGVQVLEAGDGTSALEILERSRVDVLVTDLQMPGEDGLSLVAWIAGHRVPIQVIVTSAHVSAQTRSALEDLGALVCLDKPIDLPTLHDAVRRALKHPRAHVGGVTLAGFVQLLEAEKRTCALRVKCEEGAGTLVFDQGVLVDAWSQEVVGDDAALAILALRDCTLDVVGSMASGRRRVTQPLSFLLLESLRRSDEAENLAQRRAREAQIEGGLQALMKIDGVLGAALVDRKSGEVLGSVECAAETGVKALAGAFAGVLQTMHAHLSKLGLSEPMTEVVTTAGRQQHLVRLLEKGDRRLFLSALIDRDKGNLVLARHQIAKLDEQLLAGVEEERATPAESLW